MNAREMRVEAYRLVRDARTILERPALSQDEAANADRMLDEADALERRADTIDQADERVGRLEEIVERHQALYQSRADQEAVVRTAEAAANLSPFDTAEYRAAFDAYLRNPSALSDLQRRALSVGTNSTGGFTVPQQFIAELVANEVMFGLMRPLCRQLQTNSDGVVPVTLTHVTAAWTAENTSISESNATFKQMAYTTHQLAAYSRASKMLVSDSAFDITAFLARDMGEQIARAEDAAILNGSGTTRPLGILDTSNADSSVAATTAASSSVLAGDDLINTYYDTLATYAQRGTWVMRREIAKAVRKLKDNNNQYLVVVSLQAGEPDTILNRPIAYVDQELASAVATTNVVAIFGDLSNYWLFDRGGMSVDASDQEGDTFKMHQVAYKAVKRFDGRVMRPEGLRRLKMA